MANHVTRRLGFVSTRFAGTDGVSLETAKWVSVLEKRGHQCFWFAGELDVPADRSRLVPEAFYRHPDIDAITAAVFSPDVEAIGASDPDHPGLTRRDFYSPYVRPPHASRGGSRS